MAKDAPTMQNTKLLLIALGLALIVVVIYNVHINRIRNEGQASNVKVLQYHVPKNAGEQIGPNDIIAVDVNKQVAAGISNRLDADEMTRFQGRQLAHNVKDGDWVLIDDVAGTEADKPSSRIPDNRFVMATIPLDRTMSFGKVLRIDDTVDLWGYMNVDGSWQATPIMNGVKVADIGGATSTSLGPKRTGDDGVASYQEIQVYVRKGLEGALLNILSHCQGRTFFLTIHRPTDKIDYEGIINPAVPKKYVSAAAAVPGYDPNSLK